MKPVGISVQGRVLLFAGCLVASGIPGARAADTTTPATATTIVTTRAGATTTTTSTTITTPAQPATGTAPATASTLLTTTAVTTPPAALPSATAATTGTGPLARLIRETAVADARTRLAAVRGVAEGTLPVADAWTELGTAQMLAGDAAGAAVAFEQALSLRLRLLGPAHADTGRVQADLALVYAVLGRYAAALTAFDAAESALKSSLGMGHPDLRNAQANGGATRLLLGDAVGAAARFEAALERMTDGGWSIGARAGLATAQRLSGDAEAALANARRVSAWRAARHGSAAVPTAIAQIEEALALRDTGDVAGAQALGLTAAGAMISALEPMHPDLGGAWLALVDLDRDPEIAGDLARNRLASVLSVAAANDLAPLNLEASRRLREVYGAAGLVRVSVFFGKVAAVGLAGRRVKGLTDASPGAVASEQAWADALVRDLQALGRVADAARVQAIAQGTADATAALLDPAERMAWSDWATIGTKIRQTALDRAALRRTMADARGVSTTLALRHQALDTELTTQRQRLAAWLEGLPARLGDRALPSAAR